MSALGAVLGEDMGEHVFDSVKCRLADEDMGVKQRALRILDGRVEQDDPSFIEAVCSVLAEKCQSDKIRLLTMLTGNITKGNEIAVSAVQQCLVDSLDDDDHEVRWAAFSALEKMAGMDNCHAIDAMCDAISNAMEKYCILGDGENDDDDMQFMAESELKKATVL